MQKENFRENIRSLQELHNGVLQNKETSISNNNEILIKICAEKNDIDKIVEGIKSISSNFFHLPHTESEGIHLHRLKVLAAGLYEIMTYMQNLSCPFPLDIDNVKVVKVNTTKDYPDFEKFSRTTQLDQ